MRKVLGLPVGPNQSRRFTVGTLRFVLCVGPIRRNWIQEQRPAERHAGGGVRTSEGTVMREAGCGWHGGLGQDTSEMGGTA